MRALAISLLLLLLLLALALQRASTRSGHPRAQPLRPAAAPRAPRPAAAPLSMPLSAPEAGPVRIDRVGPVHAAMGRAGTPDSGRTLRLRVEDRGTGAPLSAFGLLLRQGALELAARTDGAGRLETEGIWSPGEVSIQHRPDADRPGRDSRWEVDPWRVRIGPRDPRGTEPEHRLTAEPPAFTLTVLAREPDGGSLGDVDVALVHVWRDAAGELHSGQVVEQRTDAMGTARFPVPRRAERDGAVRLLARDPARARSSRFLTLDAPLGPGPWTLVLEPCGCVRVQALDRLGRPLARGFVTVTSADTARAAIGLGGARIEDGVARVEGLGPGRHRLRVQDDETGDRRVIEVDVDAGRESDVAVRFDDGRTALAAGGRVLDEEGRGLGGVRVWLETGGAEERYARTDADGAFRFFAPPAEWATVSTANEITSDDFAPARTRVPFGATDVVLRRTTTRAPRSVAFLVTDGDTGKPPTEGGVYLLRGEPRSAGGWRWADLVEGRTEFSVPWRPGLRYRVHCAGYLPVEEALPADGPPEGPVTVTLRRGFRRVLTVLDASTGVPLAEARIRDPEGRIDRATGEQGRAELVARDWPTRLRVERHGYHARVVELGDLELVSDRIALLPRGPR